MAQIFGFHETLPLNAKDIFIWKKFYKGDNSNERNHGREAFYRVINMSIAHHINLQRKSGSEATIKSTAIYIQQVIYNILTHFKSSRLAHILSKQVILDGILMLGFSPTVMCLIIVYDMIDDF